MTIPTYTPPDNLTGQIRTDVTECINVNLKRNYLLKTEVDPIISDPAQWDALTSDQQELWTKYNSDLRAIVGGATLPSSVKWPTKP